LGAETTTKKAWRGSSSGTIDFTTPSAQMATFSPQKKRRCAPNLRTVEVLWHKEVQCHQKALLLRVHGMGGGEREKHQQRNAQRF